MLIQIDINSSAHPSKFQPFFVGREQLFPPKVGTRRGKSKERERRMVVGFGNGVEMIDPFPGGNWRKEEEEKKEEEFDESVRRRRAIGRGAPSG